MLDRFLVGRVDRISPEAPVPVVLFDREESRVGGAANVAQQRSRARRDGASGRPRRRGRARGHAARGPRRPSGIGADGLLTDPDRRTTVKMRVVTTRNQQVARVDYETDGEAARRRGSRPDPACNGCRRNRAGHRGVGLPEGRCHAAAHDASRRAGARARRAAARRSEDPASGLLRGRDAHHAEPPRGGDRHPPAHPGRGRRAGGCAGVPGSCSRGRRAHHARRTRHVAAGRLVRGATCPRRRAKWPMSPARATR